MMGRDNITAVMMAILLVLLAAGLAFAIPPVINYQGKLVDSVGDPVNDSVDITFTIYNAPTGGDVLWTETQAVGVVNGIFNVYLGSINTIPDSTFYTDVVYLGVKVGTNAEMTPRQLYSAAPYAFRAHSADMVADGAVTSAMITNGTIIGTDIATDSITSNEIATGAVTTGEIADGTITDADIDVNAAISASKINPNGLEADTLDGVDSSGFLDKATYDSGADGKVDESNNADTLDGLDSTVFSRKYEKVAVVALEGGDYTSPVDAVSDLANWCGTPSMTNPCLIKVMPGIYDIGTNSVVLQPLLNIEGSGINSTLITGSIDSAYSGVIVSATTSEIKHLTVQNTGGGTNAVAIYNNGQGDPRIYDVRADAHGATNCFTIKNEGGVSTEIRVVTAFANCTGSNTAIRSNDSSPTIENSNVEVWGGSSIAYGIYFNSSPSSHMSNVRVKASSEGNTATGVYYTSSDGGEMHHVIAETKGLGTRVGINVISSTVKMKNVTATASSDNQYTKGINITGANVNVDMENVSVEATESSHTQAAVGIYADASSGGFVRMKGVSVSATDGSSCYGIDAYGVAGSYMPMTDVKAWCINGATSSVGIRADGGSGGNSGDFGMKNVEAYGASNVGTDSYGIWLSNKAYASMQGVEALGNGGTAANYGIYASDSEIEGVNVRTQGEGDGIYSYGLYMVSITGKTARITGGLIKSHGGSYGFGVYLGGTSSSVELTGVKVQVTNAGEATGISGEATTGSITVDSSRIEVEGSFYTVFAGTGYYTTIGSTRLKGVKPTSTGPLYCASSYHDMGGSLVDALSDCQ